MYEDNPITKAFIDAALEVLRTMAMLELKVETIEEPGNENLFLEYAAVVDLTCEVGAGSLVVTLSDDLSKNVVASMLGLVTSELEGDADLCDGVGELINMIAGNAKTSLSQTPYRFDFSLPRISHAGNLEFTPPANVAGRIANCTIGSEELRIEMWMNGIEI